MFFRTRRRLCYLLSLIACVLIWMSEVLMPSESLYTWPGAGLQSNFSDLEPHQLVAHLESKAMELSANTSAAPFKKILFWNEAYGGKTYGVGFGRDAFKNAGCPVWQCEGTDDRSSMAVQDFDAVLFHLRSWDHNDLPRQRSARQRYVFWSIESPAYRIVNTDLMKDFFNWTMTYRWDSDIVQPYGWFEPNSSVALHPDAATLRKLLDQTRAPDSVNYAAGKKKTAAWFVSNCHAPSARNAFVKRLKKYVDVDVYGECGNLLCPRSREESCRRMAEQKYKFYLSLENSLCLDYVTEKYFGMMHYNVVPIVLSLQGSHQRFSPPHSFINAMDFSSVRRLADYLKDLDTNDTKYNEYFWWKSHYAIRNSERDFVKGMCRLCAALHENLPAKSYGDMTAWWDRSASCGTLKFS